MNDSSAALSQWPNALLWVQGASDLLLVLVCCALVVSLFRVRWRRDLPLKPALLSLALFAAAVAGTHLAHFWNVWHALEGLVLAFTLFTIAAAIAVIVTLTRLLRAVLDLPNRAHQTRAEEKLARLTQEFETFSSSMSHDLRSPLTTIAGQAGMLELSLPAHEEHKRRLQRIQTAVKQMAERLDGVRALGRVSRHPLQPETVNVSALAEEIIIDLTRQQPERRVEIDIQPDITVIADAQLLRELCTQLLSNAWKFTRPVNSARIEVGRMNGDGHTTVYVRDNGIGFDSAHAAKLFQPFHKLHAEFEGSGIGLALAARIVSRHDGQIKAESQPQQGTTIYFSLYSQ